MKIAGKEKKRNGKVDTVTSLEGNVLVRFFSFFPGLVCLLWGSDERVLVTCPRWYSESSTLIGRLLIVLH